MVEASSRENQCRRIFGGQSWQADHVSTAVPAGHAVAKRAEVREGGRRPVASGQRNPDHAHRMLGVEVGRDQPRPLPQLIGISLG